MMRHYLNPFQFIISDRTVFRRSANSRSWEGIINLFHAKHECVVGLSGMRLYGVRKAVKGTCSAIAQQGKSDLFISTMLNCLNLCTFFSYNIIIFLCVSWGFLKEQNHFHNYMYIGLLYHRCVIFLSSWSDILILGRQIMILL
jgi:hypothetical protein